MQKTAYEMRISDWSSDVCSSDLCRMSLLSKLFGKAPDRAVEIESSGVHFNVPPGTTILERALAEGIAYPHDCTVGTCGSCRTRLISGKVEAITPFGYTLSREEPEAGYLLACQALPQSHLVLDFAIGSSAHAEAVGRLEELPVGNECVRPGRTRGAPIH